MNIGQDIFSAKIVNIRNVMNVEVNHMALMQWRVSEMYNRLKGLEANEVSAITLCPIAYCYEQVNEGAEADVIEKSFNHEGAAREFEVAFLKHCPADPSISNVMLRTRRLQNNIVWELVNGQHIVVACKHAQQRKNV